ncbi:putative major facilitator superfamily (MFS) drug efflux transporter [Rhizobium tropici CIAT 899]|uniref:DHA1 family inner membrane transport protein n=1 Tax=Rhizobium tropici TaxID=398 RepID=A0A6P1C630_RHITR|nr:putative major facilitator superfamily (MFS) drug efflux transporter [Rhizobium tropici CIAT 899]MBB4241472.1 DHA1 family inner membrane transport protein [Rhizobium tropici]TGE98193.1 MFS transporter [Rhizobium sp. SEMIA 4088]MBB5592788.1 DHA1 family inner membrane transport protein [Rhizobium tropici]MBB6491830.1 DHA1 family inner membrane transport protein [Rhizobium tropici]
MSDISVEALDSQTIVEVPSRTAIALVTLALAVGSFGIGTGEFVIMGLLPEVANTFGVTTPEAGHVISAYALGVVVGAPIIAVLAAKMARRTLLLLMMAIFAAGNISSAFAPTFESFTALRFITGLPHGAYFGVAALVAASMVPVHRRVRAVGQVMLGLTIATLIGTPIATFLGQLLNWRAAFMMVGAIGLATMLLIALFLPKDRVEEGASIARELGALKRIQVWLSLGVAAVGFGGMFSIFSYVATTTTEVAGLGSAMVPVVLALFGIGMNVGNIVGSRLGDISIKGTIGGMMIFNIVIMTLFSLTAANPIMLCICVFLIGCGFAACPAVQTRLMDVAADAQTLAAASNHSAFNIANALGAWLGGLVISWGFTAAATGYVGAVLSVGGLAVFAVSVGLERRTGRA